MCGLFFLRFSFSASKYLKKDLYLIFFILVTVNVTLSTRVNNKTGIHTTDFTFEALPKIMRALRHITLLEKRDQYICQIS